MARGWIRPTDATEFAECPGCRTGEVERVQPIVNRRTGEIGLYVPCPECGWSPVQPESLRRWVIDLAAFATTIAHAAGIRGVPEPFADGRGWLLGRATWAKRSHEVFLVRAVYEKTPSILHERLHRHPKAVIFAASSEDAAAWQPLAGDQQVVVLDALLSFDGELRCDLNELEALVQPEPTAVKTRRAKSTGKKAALLAKIDLLKQELIAHIRAAQEYAYDQEERTGEAALLPRPTQAKLGELVGLEKYEVSRCFHDEAGRELRLLWEIAGDLNQLLRFRS